MVKGPIQKEDITIVNIYAPNTGAPRYIQQILADIKGEIDGSAIIVGEFNTPLTPMDRSSRQKTNKATEILKETIEKLEHSQESTTYWDIKRIAINLGV